MLAAASRAVGVAGDGAGAAKTVACAYADEAGARKALEKVHYQRKQHTLNGSSLFCVRRSLSVGGKINQRDALVLVHVRLQND